MHCAQCRREIVLEDADDLLEHHAYRRTETSKPVYLCDDDCASDYFQRDEIIDYTDADQQAAWSERYDNWLNER